MYASNSPFWDGPACHSFRLCISRPIGQLYGYLFASFVVGSAVGPYMMGLAFERLHSYDPAFGVFMVLASAVIHGLGP